MACEFCTGGLTLQVSCCHMSLLHVVATCAPGRAPHFPHTVVVLCDRVLVLPLRGRRPSGGDWGLQRTAAVELEGVTGATIDQCTFERLDGNALMLSSFVRDTVISNSEFAWTGDSAIIAWGDTVGTGVPGYGVDGTASDQPRGTTLQGNYARELGLFEKQSSFYFQAKTCQTTLSNNIFFNGPVSLGS